MVEADPSAFTSPVDRFSQTRTPLSSRPASTPGTPRSLTSLGPSVSLHSGLRLLRRRRRLSAESLPAPGLVVAAMGPPAPFFPRLWDPAIPHDRAGPLLAAVLQAHSVAGLEPQWVSKTA